MINSEFVLLVITGVWVTVVLTRSYAFQWFRDLVKNVDALAYLSECALCMGTWSGIVLGTIKEDFYYIPLVGLVSYLVVLWVDKMNRD